MKKFVIAAMIAACIALCTAVWLHMAMRSGKHPSQPQRPL